jgi:hypothetical protein
MAKSKISGDLSFRDGETEKSLIAELAALNTGLTDEAARAEEAEGTNASAVSAEAMRAAGAELALSERIDTLEAAGTVVYGVMIDTTNPNPSTAVTYTDDAVGMKAASGNNGDYKAGDLDACFPWNKIKPCLLQDGAVVGYLNPHDFTKFEGGDAADITSGDAGDVMIEIPHFWYKIGRVGNYVEVKVSNTALAGFTDFAFSYKGDVKDSFYIGAYLGYKDGNGKLRSLSGQVVTGTQTIGQFRTAAQANGAGYEQLSFNKLTALQTLFVLQFGGLNSQLALGQGYTSASAYRNTGATDQSGMNYGTNTAAAATDTVKFNGIEDFYGNLYQWVDGYISAASGNSVDIADGNFNDTGADYANYPVAAINIGGYMKDVMGDNNTGFTPRTVAGSTTTYYCDYGYLYAAYLPFFGGYRSSGAGAGAFYFFCNFSASSASASVGARLLFCG